MSQSFSDGEERIRQLEAELKEKEAEIINLREELEDKVRFKGRLRL